MVNQEHWSRVSWVKGGGGGGGLVNVSWYLGSTQWGKSISILSPRDEIHLLPKVVETKHSLMMEAQAQRPVS